MTAFQETIKDRKALVPSSRRQKRGSRSKKVTLPHDNLSPAQLRKLNGKVETYRMHQPMVWQQFKEMPDDLAREYIKGLDNNYHANYRCLSAMFGVSQETIRRHLEAKDIPFSPRKGAMSKPDAEAWAVFISGKTDAPKQEISEPSIDEKVVSNVPMKMDGFTLQFSGKIDAQNLVQTLMYMLGPDAICNVKIEVTK